MLVLAEGLLQEEELVVQHDLRVDVLDEDPEPLAVAVDLVVPLEVGGEGEVDAEGGARDGLDVADEVELGELVDVLVDGAPQLGHADQLADLVGAEVVEAREGKVLLLDLLDDLGGDLLELWGKEIKANLFVIHRS